METHRRLQDSMKSTWRRDPSQWGFYHKALSHLGAFHNYLDQPVPTFPPTAKVPYMTEWSCHVFLLINVLWPMALHLAYNYVFGHNLPAIAAFFLYTAALQINMIREVRNMRKLGYQVGYLDGTKHERDEVPDVGVAKVWSSVMLTTIIRPIFTIFLSYRTSQGPSLSYWLPIELALYSVVLDGWFYLYHRSCHEVGFLWQYHRTHHLTKHPSPLLSAYADHEQEVIEIALVPLLTYVTLKLMGFPMGFYDWWVCHSYILFAEALGHSGLRVYATVPGVHTWLLKLTGTELALEDHDLHHRKGWKTSHNYGKQTRVWDRLFGTCIPRIESAEENVDWEGSVNFPLI